MKKSKLSNVSKNSIEEKYQELLGAHGELCQKRSELEKLFSEFSAILNQTRRSVSYNDFVIFYQHFQKIVGQDTCGFSDDKNYIAILIELITYHLYIALLNEMNIPRKHYDIPLPDAIVDQLESNQYCRHLQQDLETALLYGKNGMDAFLAERYGINHAENKVFSFNQLLQPMLFLIFGLSCVFLVFDGHPLWLINAGVILGCAMLIKWIAEKNIHIVVRDHH
jgi:hypothetical protein